jgi:hypothetical protein
MIVTSNAMTPAGLMAKLAIYFVPLLGSIILISITKPELLQYMPLGGTDAIEIASLEFNSEGLSFSEGDRDMEITESPSVTGNQIARIALYLSFSLAGTTLVMAPITWTYMATKRETGFKRNFVRALVVLPICATTIVMLIQDSLALAFGLAALVAAVRFRVALTEAIDGIYIFSAICVGLAAGIGYLGIAVVMALFFCYANAIMWQLEYGRNPIDDEKRQKKRTGARS